MDNKYMGKKAKVIDDHILKHVGEVEGIIEQHEIDDIGRDVVRLKITKGRTAITDYFLKDIIVKQE